MINNCTSIVKPGLHFLVIRRRSSAIEGLQQLQLYENELWYYFNSYRRSSQMTADELQLYVNQAHISMFIFAIYLRFTVTTMRNISYL